MNEDSTKELGQVIHIDDERVQDYLRNAVRGSVEETLNGSVCATPADMNGARHGATSGRGPTGASCRRRLAKSR
jgi:hypothetical protein